VTFDLFLRWATQGPLGPLVFQLPIYKTLIQYLDSSWVDLNTYISKVRRRYLLKSFIKNAWVATETSLLCLHPASNNQISKYKCLYYKNMWVYKNPTGGHLLAYRLTSRRINTRQGKHIILVHCYFVFEYMPMVYDTHNNAQSILFVRLRMLCLNLWTSIVYIFYLKQWSLLS